MRKNLKILAIGDFFLLHYFSIDAYFEQKREIGWGRLLSKQYEMALEGSVPLLIWMGKNYLGQTDKQHLEQEVSGNLTSNLNLKNLTDEELLMMDALLKKAEAPQVGPVPKVLS